MRLGKRLRASVVLLHVVETQPTLPGAETVGLDRIAPNRAALAEKQLQTLARKEGRGVIKISTLVRSGKPFNEIGIAAAEVIADLIVIATHGHTGIQRAWLGSTAERVVRHAPCPVLTVPANNPFQTTSNAPPLGLKKILVPIDFSQLSQDALPYALQVAADFNAEITLVHVVQLFPIDRLLGAEMTHQALIPSIKQAEADLQKMAAELRASTGIPTSVSVLTGTPHSALCEAARSLEADLVILTTHGYTGLNRFWLGSTAERVIRQAPCPVLAVRGLATT